MFFITKDIRNLLVDPKHEEQVLKFVIISHLCQSFASEPHRVCGTMKKYTGVYPCTAPTAYGDSTSKSAI